MKIAEQIPMTADEKRMVIDVISEMVCFAANHPNTMHEQLNWISPIRCEALKRGFIENGGDAIGYAQHRFQEIVYIAKKICNAYGLQLVRTGKSTDLRYWATKKTQE